MNIKKSRSGAAKATISLVVILGVVLSLAIAESGTSVRAFQIITGKEVYKPYTNIDVTVSGSPYAEFGLSVLDSKKNAVYQIEYYSLKTDSKGEYHLELPGFQEGKYRIKLVTTRYVIYSDLIISNIIEIPYPETPKALTEIQETSPTKEQELRIASQKPNFKLEERPRFTVYVDKPILATSSFRASNMQVHLEDSDGREVDVNPILKQASLDEYDVEVPNTRSIKPGMYKLVVETPETKQFIWFKWGVLAINTHKSIYKEGEESLIGIAVLDNQGRVVCDADVSLEITDPLGHVTRLTTEDKIAISEECNYYGITNMPDYYTSYTTNPPGTYIMHLTATIEEGTSSITSEFFVEETDFDVSRDGPTRIYPPVQYNMNFTIDANIDYSGPITESVPSSFEIEPQNNLQVSTSGDTKYLTWNEDFKSGESYSLAYEFDAPDVSPYLYELGPLQIGEWQEKRNWMIASDAPQNDQENRSNSVWYLMGHYSGDGDTGQTSNTRYTFEQYDFKLEEENVSVKNAFIIFEGQYPAYADPSTTFTYELAFDACEGPCSADAWSGTGNVLSAETNTLIYDETESNQVRILLDVTNEAQLAAYMGNGTNMTGEVGYNLSLIDGTVVSAIGYARSRLVLTYEYDASSSSYTRTVVYPLDSTTGSDQGTRTTIATRDCTKDTNCPVFDYFVNVPEFDTSLSQWFVVSGEHDSNNAVDVSRIVNIQGTDIDSNVFIHESALSGTQGLTSEGSFTNVPGYSVGSAQQLEVHGNSSGSDDVYIIGGEVWQTYNASSDAGTKTKTVMFPIGSISDTSPTTAQSATTTVYLPETGADIESAWFRIITNDDVNGADSLIVSTQVGGNPASGNTVYAYNAGGTIVSAYLKIYHIIPTSDYAALEAATGSSGVDVTVTVTSNNADTQGVSAVLMITYNYTDDSAGYLSSLAMFGGQEEGVPSLSYTTGSGAIDPPLSELFGTKTIRSGILEPFYIISDSDAAMVSGAITFDANISATASCSTSNSYTVETDGQNTASFHYDNVTAYITNSDADTYTACYSNNDGGDTTVASKKNGILYITYQWDDTDAPSVENAQINSTMNAILGSAVKVNATVTDIGNLHTVWIEVTQPDMSTYNTTTGSSGSEYYNDTIVLDTGGNYSFRFFANDTLGYYNFTVNALTLDGSPNVTVDATYPQIGDNFINVSSANVNDVVCINVTGISDNVQVDQVWAEVTSTGGISENITMSDTGSCAGISDDGVYSLDVSVGALTGYFFYNASWVNDTSNNINTNGTSQNISVTGTDELKPDLDPDSPSNTSYGTGDIDYNMTGNEPLDTVFVYLDAGNNMTMVSDDVNHFFNLSGNHPALTEGYHTAFYWANDSSGNSNTTNISFTVDLSPPNIDGETLNNTDIDLGDFVRLNMSTEDSITDVTEVLFEIQYPNGTILNHSATEVSTNYWEYDLETSIRNTHTWTEAYAISTGGTNMTQPSDTFDVYGNTTIDYVFINNTDSIRGNATYLAAHIINSTINFVEGQNISFYYGTTFIDSDVTNSTGWADIVWVISSGIDVGEYTINASFEGNTTDLYRYAENTGETIDISSTTHIPEFTLNDSEIIKGDFVLLDSVIKYDNNTEIGGQAFPSLQLKVTASLWRNF
ncbi:MAG: hypothetical protein ABIH52_00565 [Candidatus Aenigmatarchaeota archaeon]